MTETERQILSNVLLALFLEHPKHSTQSQTARLVADKHQPTKSKVTRKQQPTGGTHHDR